jgi:hypothetical protein
MSVSPCPKRVPRRFPRFRDTQVKRGVSPCLPCLSIGHGTRSQRDPTSDMSRCTTQLSHRTHTTGHAQSVTGNGMARPVPTLAAVNMTALAALLDELAALPRLPGAACRGQYGISSTRRSRTRTRNGRHATFAQTAQRCACVPSGWPACPPMPSRTGVTAGQLNKVRALRPPTGRRRGRPRKMRASA